MRDLWIQNYGVLPSLAVEAKIATLTAEGASEYIGELLREVGRAGMYTGPEPGDEAYDALSDAGREAADRVMVPDGWQR